MPESEASSPVPEPTESAPPVAPPAADATESAPPPPLAAEPPPIVPESPKLPEPQPFLFHGDTWEYFRIWIVNTLLTLLTLGIFAAWAKVRKRRYLRGNTELMGHRFDYRADPRGILAGNLLVVVLFLAYAIFGEVYPMVRFGAIGLGLVLLPWVVARSLAFNAHNTSYRGMRFYCRQTYGWTAMTYLGQFLFVILTLGIFYPAWIRNRRHFVISSHRLGNSYFNFQGRAGPFYTAYLVGGSLVLGAMIAGGTFMSLSMAARGAKVATFTDLLPFFAVYGGMLYLAKHYIYAQLFNYVWNHTQLDAHRFRADLPVGAWVRLQMTNLAAIIGTAGLLYPWAQVRSARFALSRLHFLPAGPIERIERLGRETGSAFGETAAEFAGIDLGL